MILAWALVFAAFYQKPELLTGAQRLMQRGMETIGDSVPSPWGPRMEFVFREMGGVIWLQITPVVVALRLALSAIAGPPGGSTASRSRGTATMKMVGAQGIEPWTSPV